MNNSATPLLPTHWELRLNHAAPRKSFLFELHRLDFSKTESPKTIFDSDALQALTLGPKKKIAFPLHDVLGIRVGLQTPLTSRLDLYLGSQLWSHPTERSLIQPTFTLGLEGRLSSWVYAKLGGSLSYRDYFGDGIFWPTDTRVAELTTRFMGSVGLEF